MKRTVKRRGETAYEYLTLVEAVRVEGKNTHRTLFRLGEVSELRESGQLDRIVKALATYAKGTYVEAGEIEGLSSPSFGAVAAVWSYFRRLGLEEHFSSLGDGRRSRVLSDTVFTMVANRLDRSVLQAPDDQRVARLGGASRRGHVPEPGPVLPGDRRPR